MRAIFPPKYRSVKFLIINVAVTTHGAVKEKLINK